METTSESFYEVLVHLQSEIGHQNSRERERGTLQGVGHMVPFDSLWKEVYYQRFNSDLAAFYCGTFDGFEREAPLWV